MDLVIKQLLIASYKIRNEKVDEQMKKLEKNKDKIKEESIMNSNSMQLFTMLSIYFLTVLVLFSIFLILNNY